MSDWITVATVEEIQPGEREVFMIGRKAIAVFNVGGQYHAIADLCTHDEGELATGELDGYIIECPRHSATFDIRTGKVLTPPALVDVPWYEVRVLEGEIQIGARKK